MDPIDTRNAADDQEKQAKVAKKVEAKAQELTLARAARAYHEEFIEPVLTTKHAAQWISSLENHIPDELWHRAIATIRSDELLGLVRALMLTIPDQQFVDKCLNACRSKNLDRVSEQVAVK